MEYISREKVAEYYYSLSGASPETCRAIATFLGEEADLIDKSVKPVIKQHPKLEHLLPNLHSWIYLPLQQPIDFLKRNLPLVEYKLGASRQVVTNGSAIIEQHKGLVSEEIIAMYAQLEAETKELETLLEGCEGKFREYIRFAGRFLDGIVGKVSERIIITDQDYDMQDKKIRDNIYKQALGKDTWLLGYDLRFMSKLTELTARSNLQRLNIYRSLSNQQKRALPEEQFFVLFPEPLGTETAGTREFFERALPNIVENEDTEGHIELTKAINSHFDARLNDILQESS